MIFIGVIIWVIWVLFLRRSTSYQRGQSLFIGAIFFSLFFFNSVDPFIGMPIYIYLCVLSILYCFAHFSTTKTSFGANAWFILIEAGLLIQMLFLAMGLVNPDSLLINKSNTDTLTLADELFTPTIDITVIKHFIFYSVYLLFILCNLKYLQNAKAREKLFSATRTGFRILMAAIIFFWLVINATGAIEGTQNFIAVAFSQKDVVAIFPSSFIPGTYSSCGWFAEPSYIALFYVLYSIIVLRQKNTFLDFFDFVIAALCTLLSNSTTAIVVTIIYFVLFVLRILLKRRNQTKTWLKVLCYGGAIAIVFSAFLALSGNVGPLQPYFDKAFSFFNSTEGWGSATFRRQSIEMALNSISQAPIFGVGIGTVYCHSELIQTVANIGLLGFAFCFAFHFVVMGKKARFRFWNIVLLVTLLLIKSVSGMLQFFTSPILLISLVACVFDQKGLGYYRAIEKKKVLIYLKSMSGRLTVEHE